MNTYLTLDVNVWNAIGCNVTKTYASTIFKNELSNALSYNVDVWTVASCNVRCREYETYFIEMQIKMSWTIGNVKVMFLITESGLRTVVSFECKMNEIFCFYQLNIVINVHLLLCIILRQFTTRTAMRRNFKKTWFIVFWKWHAPLPYNITYL